MKDIAALKIGIKEEIRETVDRNTFTVKDKQYVYTVVIPLNPVIMQSLTIQQQLDFEAMQERNNAILSKALGNGDTLEIEGYFDEIYKFIFLAINQYIENTHDPKQVLNDIENSIQGFTITNFRNMRVVDEYEYKYIVDTLIGMNRPLIDYYKELTGDTNEIPKKILDSINERAGIVNEDLESFKREHFKPKKKAKSDPPAPQYQVTPIKKSNYFLLSTDRGLNAAFRADTSKRNLGILFPSENDLVYQTPAVTVTITDFYKQIDPLHFSTAAKMVLSTIILLHHFQKTKRLNLKISDYMDLRGLKDRKSAREQLAAQLDLLWHTYFDYDDYDYIDKVGKNGKKYKSKKKVHRKIRLVQELDFGRGYVNITLGDTMFERLQQINDMNFLAQYPVNLLKLSTLEDFAFSMGDMFTRLEREQLNQPNFHIHAVSTVLEQCEFPKPEKLIAGGERHIPRLIIEPFDRALKRLIEIGVLTDYTYKESNGKKADYDRLIMDYAYFITLNVHIDTPTDYSHLQEKKAQQMEKAAANKKKKS